MVEFHEIEKEYEELERNDEWEEIFRVNFNQFLRYLNLSHDFGFDFF